MVVPEKYAEQLSELVTAKVMQIIGHLDEQRALKRLSTGDVPPAAIGRVIGVPTTNVPDALAAAAEVSEPLAGTIAATPYELCQRYRIGQISRDDLVRTLINWPYEPTDKTEGPLDDYLVTVAGSFDDVVQAANDALIDNATYGAIASGRATHD